MEIAPVRARDIPINLFVSHSFSPKSGAYMLPRYREAILRAIEEATEVLRRKGSLVRITPTFENNDFGRPLRTQIISSIEASSCSIVDLTDVSSNVMYELGYLDARNIPCLLTRSSKSIEQVPMDIAGRLFAEYDTEDTLSNKLAPGLASAIETSLKSFRIIPTDRDFVWFPADTQGIHVVCPHSPDGLFTADIKHPNYVYLEQFSDKDALLELMVLLSRNFAARVHKYTSLEFPQRQLIRENIVVVGGPGIEGVGSGNHLCREMTRRVKSRLKYAPDGESLEFRTDEELLRKIPQYTSEGHLLKDFGYFARFPNPFEPKSTVVMVHGLHTAGVLGSALAFSDRPQAAQNFRTARFSLGQSPADATAFEALFEVERMAGEVLVPRLDENLIFPLEVI